MYMNQFPKMRPWAARSLAALLAGFMLALSLPLHPPPRHRRPPPRPRR